MHHSHKYLGGLLGAALLWPLVVVQLSTLLATEFAGSFAAAPGFFLVAAIILLLLPVNQQADARQDEQSRARHAGEQPSTRNTGDEQVTFKIQMYG